MFKSKISPGIFIASILCFLFPFVTVSCGGEKLSSFSGLQLAVGTTVEQPQMFGPPLKQKVAPEPTAAVAAMCAILGLALSFVGARIAIAPAVTAGVGALCLLLMKSRLDDEILKQGQGVLQLNYELGFSLTLLLFLAATAWNVYLFSRRGKNAEVTSSPPTLGEVRQVAPSGSPGSMFCGSCGAETTDTSKFCRNCGKPVMSAPPTQV